MAYVVSRPRGRFEIRESVHTPRGPRARSLANFARLTDEVLATARRRASRPFDPEAVRASAGRAGAQVDPRRRRRTRVGAHTRSARTEARRFVQSSRRMAASLADRPPEAAGRRRDPGDTLIDLLNFAEQITPFTPEREAERLAFPVLARVAAATEARRSAAGAEGRRGGTP